MAYGLALEWVRCLDGVEAFDQPVPPPFEARGLLSLLLEKAEPVPEPPKPLPPVRTFRFKSDRLTTYRRELRDLTDPMVLDFVNASSERDQIAFTAEYGSLFNRDGIETRVILFDRLRQLFSGYLSATANATDNIEELNRFFKSPLCDVSLKPALVPRAGDPPSLVLQAGDPVSFMVMEMSMMAVGGSRFTSCRQCGTLMVTGASTGRRSHAWYCSDRCRVAYSRAQKKMKAEAV